MSAAPSPFIARNKRRFTMSRILLVMLCACVFANAQTGGAPVLTLEEALSLAKSNNRELRQISLEVGKQQEALGEAKTHLYPRLDTTVLAAQLLEPLDFKIETGQFGTYPGTGPIPGTNTNLHTPARPIAIASVTATQPLTQLIRIHLFIADQRLKVARHSCPSTNASRSSQPMFASRTIKFSSRRSSMNPNNQW